MAGGNTWQKTLKKYISTKISPFHDIHSIFTEKWNTQRESFTHIYVWKSHEDHVDVPGLL